jgi:ABC-type xylose transport system permease subunit
MLEEVGMFVIDAVLILAMMFFLFLPITDRRTVRMKLCVLCALLAVFAATATRTHVSQVQLAGIESTR